jgi:hypothetical protein
MALKTIYFHCCIFVTTLAEMFVAAEHTVIGLASVAFHTTCKAEFAAADTLTHCLFALVYDLFHVVLTHELWIIHALTSITDVELGRKGTCRPSRRGGKQ